MQLDDTLAGYFAAMPRAWQFERAQGISGALSHSASFSLFLSVFSEILAPLHVLSCDSYSKPWSARLEDDEECDEDSIVEADSASVASAKQRR